MELVSEATVQSMVTGHASSVALKAFEGLIGVTGLVGAVVAL